MILVNSFYQAHILDLRPHQHDDLIGSEESDWVEGEEWRGESDIWERNVRCPILDPISSRKASLTKVLRREATWDKEVERKRYKPEVQHQITNNKAIPHSQKSSRKKAWYFRVLFSNDCNVVVHSQNDKSYFTNKRKRRKKEKRKKKARRLKPPRDSVAPSSSLPSPCP